MKTRWVFQQETIRSTAGKSGNARLLSLFAIVLAEIFIPATASGQARPSIPLGGPLLDSSEFRFRVSGAPGDTCIVRTSTDLMNWKPVFTNFIPASGYFDFVDSQTGRFPQRFYRTDYLPGTVSVKNLLESF